MGRLVLRGPASSTPAGVGVPVEGGAAGPPGHAGEGGGTAEGRKVMKEKPSIFLGAMTSRSAPCAPRILARPLRTYGHQFCRHRYFSVLKEKAN